MKKLGFGLAAILSLSLSTATAIACPSEREVAPEQVPTQPAVYTLRTQFDIIAPDLGESGAVGDVRASLRRLNGVKAVEVKLAGDTGRVIVRFNPRKVKRADLIKAVEALGYKLHVPA